MNDEWKKQSEDAAETQGENACCENCSCGATGDEKSGHSCEGKCIEYLNNWKRAQADYNNLQKQLAREREEHARYALWRAVEAFLPTVDHFATAMRHEPTEANALQWTAGMKHIWREFEESLKTLGVTKIDAMGKQFDPAKHESVSAKEAADVPPGTVVGEQQAGYMIGDRVLRPSRVIVSEHPKEKKEE